MGAGPELISLVKGPKEAWETMVEKGVELSHKSAFKVFHQATLAGCYIGFGGMLSLTIAGGLAKASKDNPGISAWVFGALFPINLIIIILTGGILYTGVSAYIPGAIYEGKIHWSHLPKLLLLSWFGNLAGALIFAGLLTYCDLNTGNTAALAIKLTDKKCHGDFLPTIIKAIFCNWMVCMAIFLSTQAQDMTGKVVGIWWPIMTFVATGYEHLPANHFTLSMGLMTRQTEVSLGDVIARNWIPATIGNFIAGAFCVALSNSYAYGRLGHKSCLEATELVFCDKSEAKAAEEPAAGKGPAPAPAEAGHGEKAPAGKGLAQLPDVEGLRQAAKAGVEQVKHLLSR